MIEVQIKREVSNSRHDRMQLAQVFAPNGMLARTYCYDNDGVLVGHDSYHFVINRDTMVYCDGDELGMNAPVYLLKVTTRATFRLPMPPSIPCKV